MLLPGSPSSISPCAAAPTWPLSKGEEGWDEECEIGDLFGIASIGDLKAEDLGASYIVCLGWKLESRNLSRTQTGCCLAAMISVVFSQRSQLCLRV